MESAELQHKIEKLDKYLDHDREVDPAYSSTDRSRSAESNPETPHEGGQLHSITCINPSLSVTMG